ncbi:hypothetical protein [Rhodococcus koreensis]
MNFPIEIKINIAGRVDAVLPALGKPRGGKKRRQIWFAEDRQGVADGRLALLNGGVIVRFRSGDGPDDLTVKLRPCLESQLPGRWSDSFEDTTESLEYRIEGDWSGERRGLAASLVSTRPQGSLLDAIGVDNGTARELKTIQRQFLETCAQPPLHVGQLVTLGPIVSTKWTDLALGDLEVNMERWQAAELDFLEVSIRVKPKDGETAEEFDARAVRKQEKFATAVRERGITIAEDKNNKTKRVLTALAATHH